MIGTSVNMDWADSRPHLIETGIRGKRVEEKTDLGEDTKTNMREEAGVKLGVGSDGGEDGGVGSDDPSDDIGEVKKGLEVNKDLLGSQYRGIGNMVGQLVQV